MLPQDLFELKKKIELYLCDFSITSLQIKNKTSFAIVVVDIYSTRIGEIFEVRFDIKKEGDGFCFMDDIYFDKLSLIDFVLSTTYFLGINYVSYE